MTGPEHYREAEQLLAGAGCDTAETAGYVDPVLAAPWLAAAQVHATLALAAAQDRLATFAETLGQVAVHTVFAGMSEEEVATAQARVREIVGLPGGGPS